MTPPRTESKPITLADLSVEDRKALLEQAREESKRNPRDVNGYHDLSDREQAIRDLMDARDHSRGCPVQEGTALGRVEGYEARRPPNPALGKPEQWLAVIRCVECGGSTVYDGETEERPLEPFEDLVADKVDELAGVSAGAAVDDDENEL
jgi:hypothetical protein